MLCLLTLDGSCLILTKTLLLVLQEDAAEALSKFYYPPVCAATISYPISAVRADRLDNGKLLGFGQLHPRSQGVQTLGTVLDSRKLLPC